MKLPIETRLPIRTSPLWLSGSPAKARMRWVLPPPLGPIRPTRSPKWTSSENGSTSPSTPTSFSTSALRAESAPRMRILICWSVTGAGGGPSSAKRRQRVSAASAFFAQTGE